MSAKSAVTQESTNGCGRMGAAVRGKLRAQTLAVALSVTMGFIGLAVPAYATDGSGNEGAPSVVTGEQKPVSITVNGETNSYDTILAALQATTDEPVRSIQLNGNVTEDGGFEVRKGTELTIDLNGHTADIHDSINVRGSLTIKDSSGASVDVVDENGTIDSESYEGGILSLDGEDGLYASIKVQNEGKLTLNSGVIRSAYSGCVSVEGGNSFTMNGGFVAAHDGYAVEVNEGAKFVLNDGIVWAEDYTAISGDNAINRGNTSIEINGGKVYSRNSTPGDENNLVGVGVCEVMDGTSSLKITGGEIRSFNAGVAVIVNKGTFEITDGQLYGAGKDFSGQTAHGIQVNKGYALMLNEVNAASTIKGGFFSADDGVPSLCISEGFVSLMSLGSDGKGVSIQGGTYTNPSGIDDYIDSGYYKLGHSLESRSAWATVMKGVATPAPSETEYSPEYNLPKKEAHIYQGQLKYYRNAKEAVSYDQLEYNSVYSDYPTISGYYFSGWWTDDGCETESVSYDVADDPGLFYAKMSDAELLYPIYQLTNNLYDGNSQNNDRVQVRLSALLDTANFKLLGMKVTRGEAVTDWSTADAGERVEFVDPMTGEVAYIVPENVVLTGDYIYSTYFYVDMVNYGVKNIAEPWWITFDGTKVSGTEIGLSVYDYLSMVEGINPDIEIPSN